MCDDESTGAVRGAAGRTSVASGSLRRSAKHAAVAHAARDPVLIEALEEELGIAPADAEEVSEARERDLAVRRRTRRAASPSRPRRTRRRSRAPCRAGRALRCASRKRVSSSSSTLVARTPASRELARRAAPPPARERRSREPRREGRAWRRAARTGAAEERRPPRAPRAAETPGSIGSAASIAARSSSLEPVEPGTREHPWSRPLHALRIPVEDEPERVRAHGRMHRRGSVSSFDARHSLGVAVARRSRVDHPSAAERRLRHAGSRDRRAPPRPAQPDAAAHRARPP